MIFRIYNRTINQNVMSDFLGILEFSPIKQFFLFNLKKVPVDVFRT